MTYHKASVLLAAPALALLLVLPRANAQTTTPAMSAADVASDQAVQLPAFEIASEKDTDYVGTTSLSSTRIAVDNSELAQSVKVLNHSFITALNPNMMSDVLDYVGGGQNGALNWTRAHEHPRIHGRRRLRGRLRADGRLDR